MALLRTTLVALGLLMTPVFTAYAGRYGRSPEERFDRQFGPDGLGFFVVVFFGIAVGLGFFLTMLISTTPKRESPIWGLLGSCLAGLLIWGSLFYVCAIIGANAMSQIGFFSFFGHVVGAVWGYTKGEPWMAS